MNATTTPVRYFSATTFFAGFASFSFVLLIPVLVKEDGYGLSTIGLVLTSYAVAVLIFGPLWGYLSDLCGRRKPFLILGYVVFAASSFLYLFADTVPALMGVRFLQGVGFAAHPMLTALFSDHYGSEATRRFGLLSGAESLGWGLGSLLGGLMAQHLGIRVAMTVVAALPLISAALTLWRLPEARAVPADPDAPTAPFPKKLFLLYGAIFVRMSAAIALWSVMPIYLQTFVDSLTKVGAITAVNLLIQPVFMIGLGRFADRLGKLKLVIWGILGTILTFWIYAAAANTWQLLVGQVSISMSWAAMVIGMNTYLMTAAPQAVRGKAFGYLTGAIMVAMAAGPLLGSLLAESIGIRGMIALVSALMLLSLPLVVRLRMMEKRTAIDAQV